MTRSVLAPPLPARERRAMGRAARERAALRTLGEWRRAADALAIITAQNDQRVQALVPIRMGRMAVSPWTYYRGAAAVMASDLAGAEHTGLDVQLCGDAHVLNFGLWATPERQLSFDLRDFDETLRGPFEWDLKRFLASLVVLARECGLPARTADHAVDQALRSYRAGIARYANAPELDIWYDLVTAADLLDVFGPEERERVSVRIEKRSRSRTSAGAARKLTHSVDGHLRIVEDPPVRVRINRSDVETSVTDVVQAYHDSLPHQRRHLLDRFTLVDVVRQVVGVGSVGMEVFLALLEGRSGDPLFLQFKQASASVYEPFLGAHPYPNHGQRVINGKQLIQAASDIFLGWTRVGDGDFYVRQFRDMKVILDAASLAPILVPFADRCASVMARAHARTGDAMAIHGYIGKGRRFDEAMAAFASRYADQTTTDHAQLCEAIADGAVPSAAG